MPLLQGHTNLPVFPATEEKESTSPLVAQPWLFGIEEPTTFRSALTDEQVQCHCVPPFRLTVAGCERCAWIVLRSETSSPFRTPLGDSARSVLCS